MTSGCFAYSEKGPCVVNYNQAELTRLWHDKQEQWLC